MSENEHEAPADALVEPQLDAIEARILGCLIEKQATTPETYPLTLNAIVVACNQKTSREPLMNLETGAVANVLRRMEARGLVAVAPSSARALRYEHRADAIYDLTSRPRAVLCVMLLRGPQTLNELLTRTERIGQFATIEAVQDTLDRLAQRSPPLVARIGRAPGQREDRFAHLLSGPVSASAWAGEARASTHDDVRSASRADAAPELIERLDRLESLVARLESEMNSLRDRFPTEE